MKESLFTEKIQLLTIKNKEIYNQENFLEKFKIKQSNRAATTDIESVYYIPNIIDKEQSELLWGIIMSQDASRWETLTYSKRRLQKWGGDVLPEGLSNIETLPNWLQSLSDFLNDLQITHQTKNVNHF